MLHSHHMNNLKLKLASCHTGKSRLLMLCQGDVLHLYSLVRDLVRDAMTDLSTLELH